MPNKKPNNSNQSDYNKFQSFRTLKKSISLVLYKIINLIIHIKYY